MVWIVPGNAGLPGATIDDIKNNLKKLADLQCSLLELENKVSLLMKTCSCKPKPPCSCIEK